MGKYLNNIFNDKKFYEKLIILALPMIIQNFIVSSLNMVDTLMIGALGENEIAAVGIANQFFFLYNLIIIGTTTGFSIFISQYWGSKNKSGIRKVLGLEIISILIIGMIFTISALAMPEIILKLFTKDTVVVSLGKQYLTTVIFSYIITGVTFLFSNALKSIGNSRPPMIVSAIAVLINASLNYVFIFGEFGFPVMGVKGAALATVIARIVEMTIIVYFSFKHQSPFRGKIKEYLDFDFIFIKKMYRSVTPVILNDAFWALGLVLYTVAYGKIGTKAIAAIQISNTIQNLFMVICFSTASASLVMIGHEIGARRKDRAIDYAYKFSVLSFILGAILGGILIFGSPVILSLFNVSEDVKTSARAILIIFGIVCPIRSLNTVLIAGIFRGSGDASFALKAESFAMWAIAVPLAFIGAILLKLSIEMVAILVASEEVVKCILNIIHLNKNQWIYDLVNIKESYEC